MGERSGSMCVEIFLHILDSQKNFKHMKQLNIIPLIIIVVIIVAPIAGVV